MAPLTQEQVKIIEKISIFGMQSGLPRSTAKVLGFFLICVPEQQTAAMAKSALQLSFGSINNGLRTLTAMGILSQVSQPNERSIFYELESSGLVKAIQQKLDTFYMAKDIASQALTIMPNNERMMAFYTIYNVIGRELHSLLKQIKQELLINPGS